MWIVYSILDGALNAVTNIIEKYVVDKHVKDTNILVIIGGVIVFAIGAILFIILGLPLVPLSSALPILLAGIFLAWYLIPYLQALTLEDASTVIPLFAFVPVMTLLLSAFFLKEILTTKQFIGFFIIFAGGITLSIERGGKGLAWIKPRKVFILMMLSCLLFSFSSILFKFVTFRIDYWTTLTYEYFGVGIGTFLFFGYLVLSNNVKWRVHGLTPIVSVIFILDKLIEIAGQAFGAYATTLAPIALVGVLSSTQPFFVFLFAVILSIWFPRIIKEDLSRKVVLTKLVAMLVMFVGIIFLTT